MPGKILGLDINEEGVAAVQVASSLKGYQVTACAYIRIEGEDGLDSALKTLFGQTDFKSDVCHCSVPTEQVSYRNLRLPFKDQKKIRQTLPFEIETMVPFPIEDLLVDFTIIERSGQSELLAAAVEKTFISTHLERLRSHGIDPDVLDIRCLPPVLWLLKQEDTPENGILLQMDGKTNTMVLFLERRIVLVRPFLFNGVPGTAATRGQEIETDKVIVVREQAATDYPSFFTLVRNTIHSFGVQNNKELRPEKIFFTGSSAIPSQTGDRLNRFFDIPAEQLDLSTDKKIHMDADTARIWNPALMNTALTLAIRETRPDRGFNFRKDEFEKKKHYFGSAKEIRRAAVFFIIAFFFLAANIGSDYHSLKKRYDALDQKITETIKETFPEVTKIPRGKELEFVESEINKIQKSSVAIPAIDGDNSILSLLGDISKRISESLTVRITRLVIDSEAVRISGITDNFNTVDKIKSDLETSTLFKEVTISSAKLDRTGDNVEFEIKLERAT